MKRKLLSLLVMLMAASASLWADDAKLPVPYTESFEDGTKSQLPITAEQPLSADDDFYDDFEGDTQWTFINGEFPNQWVIGSAVNNGGEKSLYISNDGGTTNAYTMGGAVSTGVYAIKLFSFNGETYTFSYDWKCIAEPPYDYLRVFLVPHSSELKVDHYYDDTRIPDGWISLDGGAPLGNVNDWQHHEETMMVQGDYYIAFYWRNDNSAGNQPPAAIDNVSVGKNPESVAIDAVASDECTDDAWYTLAGVKLQGKPTVKGVYLYQGKAVLVK